MTNTVEVAVRFEFAAGAKVVFSNMLELSLDCLLVDDVLEPSSSSSESHTVCTPTGHIFPGRIIRKDVCQDGSVAAAFYTVEYDYEAFSGCEVSGTTIAVRRAAVGARRL